MSPTLSDLLSRYRDARDSGRPLDLDDLCRDAPELRDALAAKIAAVESMERLLDLGRSGSSEDLGRDRTVEGPIEPVLPSGTRIGDYELIEELGRGGMAVVYKARQHGLGRLVALKMILSGSFARPAVRQRFLGEARSVAKLNHANIVQVYDTGIHEERPYFSMELCAGGSLAERLQAGPLEAKTAAWLAQTLARAVQTAHDSGIIHRDLKPANVLLQKPFTTESTETTEREKEKRRLDSSSVVSVLSVVNAIPKIADFGLAKQDDSDLTETRTVFGTPSYMPPEQTVDSRTIDHRADVYALGAILYECLTGRPPFQAATTLDTLDQVRKNDPVPVRQLQPKTPRDLETICLKCLRKDPARRYQTARELTDDLGRFLNGEPIKARPVGAIERGYLWAGRNRALAALYGVVALTMVGLVGVGFWLSALFGAASTQKFFASFHEAGKIIADLEPGWSWKAFGLLKEAAGSREAAAHRAEMRTLATRCLGSPDVRLVAKLAPGVSAYSLAWSPNGKTLALGEMQADDSEQCRITLVDPDRAEPEKILTVAAKPAKRGNGEPGPDQINSLAFSPDGKTLAAGTRSGWLHYWRWDSSSDPEVHSFAVADTTVRPLVFAPDGQSVFFNAGTYIKGFSLEAGREKWSHATGAKCLGLSLFHVGDRLVCSTEWGLHFLSTETGQDLRPGSVVLGGWVEFTALGSRSYNKLYQKISVFDLDRCEVVGELADPDIKMDHLGPSRLSLNTTESLLVTACPSTKTGCLWDLAARRLAAHFFIGGGTCEIGFAPDGRTFAVCADNHVQLYEVGGQDIHVGNAFHSDPITSFALSPEGDTLACSSYPGSPAVEGTSHGAITTWTLQGGRCDFARSLSWSAVATDDVSTVFPFFKRSGHLLSVFTLHSGKTAFNVWNIATGERQTDPEPKPFPGELHSIVLAPEESLFATTNVPAGENLVREWAAAGASERVVYKNPDPHHTGRPQLYGLAAGKSWLLVGGRDPELRILRRGVPGDVVAQPTVGDAPLCSLALSPDESKALVGNEKGRLFLMSVPQGEVLAEFDVHRGEIKRLAWSPAGLIVSASRDGVVKLWRLVGNTLEELFTIKFGRQLRQAELHPDGIRLFVLLLNETAVRVWHLDRLRAEFEAMNLGHGLEVIQPQPLPAGPQIPVKSVPTLQVEAIRNRALPRHDSLIRAVAFLPDGKHLLSAGDDHTIRLFDTADGREIRRFTGHTDRVVQLALSPGGRHFASGGSEGQIILWDSETGGQEHFKGSQGWVAGLAFSPNGSQLLAGCHLPDPLVRVWDVGPAQQVAARPGHKDHICRGGVAWLADGHILSASSDGTVHLWHPSTSHQETFPHEVEGSNAMALSPNGRQIAIQNDTAGGNLAVIDLATKKRVWITRPDQTVGYPGLTWSRCGHYLFLTSPKRLWAFDSQTGREVATWETPYRESQSLAVSPDGTTLALASTDEEVIGLYRVKSPHLTVVPSKTPD